MEGWIPVFLFATLFGLSMDYEVFLVGRMRESWEALGDNTRAVAMGLERTGRIVTGAALIMVAAFSGFVAGRIGVLSSWASGSPSGSSSTRRSSECCSFPPRWRCSAAGTGGCPGERAARPPEWGALPNDLDRKPERRQLVSRREARRVVSEAQQRDHPELRVGVRRLLRVQQRIRSIRCVPGVPVANIWIRTYPLLLNPQRTRCTRCRT